MLMTACYRKLTFFVLLSAFGTLQSQTELTLQACLQEAYQNSNLLRAADYTLAASEERLQQSTNRRLPTLAGRGSYLRIGKITSFSVPMGPGGPVREFRFGTPNRINGDISLNVPIFTWGSLQAQIDAARLGVKMSEEDRRQKALEVTDQVLRAFYTVLLNQEALRTAQLQFERAEKNALAAQERFAAGHAPKLESLRAEVQRSNALAQLEEARSAYEKSLLWLAKTIGHEGEALIVAGKLEFVPATVNADSLIDRALERRIDLKLLDLQRQTIARQADIVAASLRPALSGVASYSIQNGFSPMDPEKFVDNWNVGVQLSFPFFDGFQTRHRLQEIEKQMSALTYQQKEIRELVAVQIRQTVETLKSAEQRVLTQKESRLLAQESLQSAELQYEKGTISSLDLLAAQQQLAETELAELRALFSHITAKIDLCRAVGDYSLFEFNP
ncbi:MAG: TolC family protein [candidate division KSB1 bacterium]|nr:TolC family protein [candidate division KSB1 bacterium]